MKAGYFGFCGQPANHLNGEFDAKVLDLLVIMLFNI